MKLNIICVKWLCEYFSYTKYYLSGDGGDKIGMALRFARDKSSVQFATPDILNVTLSLNIVSFLVGVEIALRSEARCPRLFAPFNYNVNKEMRYLHVASFLIWVIIKKVY